VDNWAFEITAVQADPGKDATRKVIVLLGDVTNEGEVNATFSEYILMLRDGHGHEYENDTSAGWVAQDRYGAGYGASLNPGASAYIAVAFDVPAAERNFAIIAGPLVASWSGDIWFQLP
jgi:hypothetical protein